MPATAAQIEAARTNSQKSTGPRTPEGKANSARNSIKLGLFTAHDFILPADQPAYDALVDAFWQDLAPHGPAEETLALEIIRASWRLQRCAKAEAAYADTVLDAAILGKYAPDPTHPNKTEVAFARVPYTPQDPLQNEAGQRFQSAIDRARASANNTFRRAMADLHRLQTTREQAAENTGQQNEAPAPRPAMPVRTKRTPAPSYPLIYPMPTFDFPAPNRRPQPASERTEATPPPMPAPLTKAA